MNHPHFRREKEAIRTQEGEKYQDVSESDYEKLKQLESMGFDNVNNNIRALDSASGNIEVAIHILSKDDANSISNSNKEDENIYSESPYADQIKTLKSMGFLVIEDNIKVLENTSGNLEAAINMLSKATDANSEPSQIKSAKKVEEIIPAETLQHYKEM